MVKLIPYSGTPQVTALEYKEMRDLEMNPDKAGYYNELAEKRRKDNK